jgi:hypothetical protein
MSSGRRSARCVAAPSNGTWKQIHDASVKCGRATWQRNFHAGHRQHRYLRHLLYLRQSDAIWPQSVATRANQTHRRTACRATNHGLRAEGDRLLPRFFGRADSLLRRRLLVSVRPRSPVPRTLGRSAGRCCGASRTAGVLLSGDRAERVRVVAAVAVVAAGPPWGLRAAGLEGLLVVRPVRWRRRLILPGLMSVRR